MLANFMNSTLLSIIIINILFISITNSDRIQKKPSDCNLCKTLFPPCCDKANCDKCRTNIRNIDGRNYVVTYVPAIIPYNSDATSNQNSNVKSRLVPINHLKVANNDKHVHRDSDKVPALIYQQDVQIQQPMGQSFVTLPKLQEQQQNQQFVPFSYWNINADDDDDSSDISASDYQMEFNSRNDDQQIPIIINASVTKSYRPKTNKAQKVQINAYTTSHLSTSSSGKVSNKKPTIKYPTYPIKINGVTYILTPGKHPKIVIADENAYNKRPVNKSPSPSIIRNYDIPPGNKPNQMPQFQVNAAGVSNAKQMPMQLNDYGVHDYNIPVDENFPLYDYPIIADKASQNVQPYLQSKIPINAYHPIIPPESLVKLSNDYTQITPDADVNQPGKLSTVYLDNPLLPIRDKVKYTKGANADQSVQLSTVKFMPPPLPPPPPSVKTGNLQMTSNAYGAIKPDENADTSYVPLNNAYNSGIPTFPYPFEINKQSINTSPVNAYGNAVFMPRIKQFDNAENDTLPLVQSTSKAPLVETTSSNDQLIMQFNATSVNADNQPVVNNTDNDTIPLSNGSKLPVSSNASSRMSIVDYDENIPLFDADAYVNDRSGDDKSITEKDRFGDINDWFDYFNDDEIGRKVPTKGAALKEAFIQPPLINVKNKKKEKVRGKVGKVFNVTETVKYIEEVTKVDDDVNAAAENDENVENVKVTESVEDDNYDESDENAPNVKATEALEDDNYYDENANENVKATETIEEDYYENDENAKNVQATASLTNEEANGDESYIDVESSAFVENAGGNMEIPIRPIQPVVVTVVKNADEKAKVVHKTIPLNSIVVSISDYFTKHNAKSPGNFGITSDTMKNDKLYQIVRSTNYQSLKKLGLLMLHLFKYLNAGKNMKPEEIIERTITDANNGKTDDLQITDSEIIAYIGWKLVDLTSLNAGNSKTIKMMKMIMMKVLDDARFAELKHFLSQNRGHQAVTHVQPVQYQKQCQCKLVPIGQP